jgi:hypothetical protein
LGSAVSAVGSEDSQISTDMQTRADLTADKNALTGDLGRLEGAVYKLKYDMPPACIAGGMIPISARR